MEVRVERRVLCSRAKLVLFLRRDESRRDSFKIPQEILQVTQMLSNIFVSSYALGVAIRETESKLLALQLGGGMKRYPRLHNYGAWVMHELVGRGSYSESILILRLHSCNSNPMVRPRKPKYFMRGQHVSASQSGVSSGKTAQGSEKN